MNASNCLLQIQEREVLALQDMNSDQHQPPGAGKQEVAAGQHKSIPEQQEGCCWQKPPLKKAQQIR